MGAVPALLNARYVGLPVAAVKETLNELVVMVPKLKAVGALAGSVANVVVVAVDELGDDPVALADLSLAW